MLSREKRAPAEDWDETNCLSSVKHRLENDASALNLSVRTFGVGGLLGMVMGMTSSAPFLPRLADGACSLA